MTVQNVFWFLLGFGCSHVVSKVLQKCKEKKKKRTQAHVVPLACGDPYFEMDAKRKDFRFEEPTDQFHLEFPKDIRKEILAVKPAFFNVSWQAPEHFLDGQSREEFVQEAAKGLGISQELFAAMLKDSRRQIAESFLQKVEEGEPYFVGYMYGIKNMQQNREGAEERPTIDAAGYLSDYYTHRVMASIYRKVYRTAPSIAPDRISPKLMGLRYFLTSLGMDTLVILPDEGPHGSVVFAKRSGKLYNMETDLWHEPMNETVSVYDADAGMISFEKSIVRGMREELGVDLETGRYPYEIRYSDIALIQDPLEMGVSAFVIVHKLTYEDLESMYLSAKDRKFESVGLTMVPLENAMLSAFLKNDPVTPACKYMVNMLIARNTQCSMFCKN